MSICRPCSSTAAERALHIATSNGGLALVEALLTMRMSIVALHQVWEELMTYDTT